MPLPSSINDLSTTAGSNSPAGSESPSTIDDYLRVYASYIAQLRDAAQSNGFRMATAGGTANVITATYSPPVTVLSDSTVLIFKAIAANTGAATFSPNGLTAKPVVGAGHGALTGGEIIINGEVCVQYNSSVGGGSWVILYSTGAAGGVVSQTLTAFTTAGTPPAYTLTPVPALGAYAAAQRYRVNIHAAPAGTPTLNISALGAKNLKQYDSTGAKVAAVLFAGQLVDVEYDGTDMVVLNPAPPSSASTTVIGVTRLATTAETKTGTSAVIAVTPAGLEFAAPLKGRCTAWVLFIGTGTPAIRDSFNVSSITRVGTGNYTVNFATSMANTAYSVSMGFDTETDGINSFVTSATPRSLYLQESLKATGSFRVLTGANVAGGGVTIDFRGINLQVFGGV